MKLDTPSPPRRVAEPVRPVRAHAPARRSPGGHRMLLALVLVALAGFLLGLGLPPHP